MKNTNNGVYTAGYIFDRLNVAAISSAKKEMYIKNKTLETQSADIIFGKNLTDLENTKVYLITAEFIGNNIYRVENRLCKGKSEIARAGFIFNVK